VIAEDWDVLVVDLAMPGMSGIELCERVAGVRGDVPVIMLTGFGSLDSAVQAIRAGAYDFLSKPVELDTLEFAVRRADSHRALTAQVARLRSEASAVGRLGDLIGESAPMRRLLDFVERIADSTASVIITGESGSGKEVVAREVHRRSARAHGPFIAINCAAMPEPLLESELFGHVRGAFTDAKSSHMGLFQQAHGGTIFLDEIGDMPPGLQAKLLRVLEQRTLRPVGGRQEVPVDVRVISATNRDLEEAMDAGSFRDDLYFRLHVVGIEVPPLRARGTDILTLAHHFLAQHTSRGVIGISAAAASSLMAYPWPGNVRELRNAIERGVALARFAELAVEDLPDRVRAYKSSHVVVASDDPSELVPLFEVERRYVARVMEAVGGNKTAAARVLGVERKRLYRMLDRHKRGENDD
jgi:two-component system response regulator HydG